MKGFYLIDLSHNREQKKKLKVGITAAQIVMKYGGKKASDFDMDEIREFWKYEEPYPTLDYFIKYAKINVIKWFIKRHIKSSDEIWTADFIQGLATNTKVKVSDNHYTCLEWYGNENLVNLMKLCPFGGKVHHHRRRKTSNKIGRNRWSDVPALHMDYQEGSISYIAGVFAGGQLNQGGSLVKYKGNAVDYIKKLGIPIEKETRDNIIFISPLWPALFSKWMPVEVRSKWVDLEEAKGATNYAAILWKTYIGTNFISNQLPYLKSRRSIYYNYKCKEGAMRKLEMLRIEKGLTGLHNRIGEVVKILKKEKQ